MAAYLHLGSAGGFAANQADAMRYVADLLGGGLWRPLIVTTVLVSTSSTLWTTVLYLSRSVFAMDGTACCPETSAGWMGAANPFGRWLRSAFW